MKKSNKLLAIAGCVTLICAVDVGISAAATSATADASGTIIAAVQISKTTNLQFGSIIAGTTQTKVTLDPAAETRSQDAGNAVLAGGTVTAAKFQVIGDGSNLYHVTLPAGSITVTSGANNMTVDTWTADQAITALSGTVDVKVGATLTVGANQAAGTYTNTGGIVVNVAYN